jgi:serine phosphatase RsbU (regulator of sigma subunit)
LSLLFPTGRPFADDDREFMMTVARLCGQALDRAQLYTQEHEVAEVLQRALLPPALPHVPGFTFDAAYETGGQKAEVGGDWYDAFRLPRGHVVLCVGDVVGRGLRAATLMGQLRHTIRTVAFESYSPSMMIERAQAVLRHSYGREAMATAAVGVLDPFESTLTYSTAGHPPPAVMRGNDAIERLELGSLPLGVAHLGTCPERVVQLSAGDAVIFYTDGLIEATRDVREGEERLLSALRTSGMRPHTREQQRSFAAYWARLCPRMTSLCSPWA